MPRPEPIPTFEEVQTHFESIDLSTLHGVGVRDANPSAALARIRVAYRTVRPVLRLIGSVPLVPTEWRLAITGFVAVLDALGE